MTVKIAVVVHGRFHAFDLTRELIRRGHAVRLLTNYPAWTAKGFGIPPGVVCSFWLEGALFRMNGWLHRKRLSPYLEVQLHLLFGHWAAAQIKRERWDVVLCWSGVAEEVFRALEGTSTLRVCHRSSSHIRTQARILKEEEARTGASLDRPSAWMVAREEREYDQADVMYIPSTFVKETFLAEGVPSQKIACILHGVDVSSFRPSPEQLEARFARVLSGKPLRILNVGTFSFRKGMLDLAEVIKDLSGERFQFRFVGPIAPEAARLASHLRGFAAFAPKRAQQSLPAVYEWADLFILPTLEDGFPFVLAQASAAGLPLLTTHRGAGVDLVREGENGWLLPVRDPNAFIERLLWCDAHREALTKMMQQIPQKSRVHDWTEVAEQFEMLCTEWLGKRLRKESAEH